MAVKKKGLGAKGLGINALINTEMEDIKTSKPEKKKTEEAVLELDLDMIEPNRKQPRKYFDETALEELAASLKAYGMIQPIVVKKSGDYYEIIAGERRWRASQIAGLTSVPAYIRTINDENVMEMALVENIQREDLNAVEIALAYQHLLDNTGMTQEKVAERVGKKRATVANFLRLLKLPAQVQMALQKKEIDMGHARALLALDDPKLQIKIFKEIVKQGYSVRKVEEIIQQLKAGENPDLGKKKIKTETQLPLNIENERKRIEQQTGQKVRLTCGANGKGKISIPFSNMEELQRILGMIKE